MPYKCFPDQDFPLTSFNSSCTLPFSTLFINLPTIRYDPLDLNMCICMILGVRYTKGGNPLIDA